MSDSNMAQSHIMLSIYNRLVNNFINEMSAKRKLEWQIPILILRKLGLQIPAGLCLVRVTWDYGVNTLKSSLVRRMVGPLQNP